MSESPPAHLGSIFYTGASGFLQANEHFARALVTASSFCAVHASEDIVDANGMKLWSGGQPIGDRLLERLSDRRLRKPIELCVYASDPAAVAGIAQVVETEIDRSAEFAAMLGAKRANVLRIVNAIKPNPTELMLLSVMRHSGRDMLPHAAQVCALALAGGELLGVHPDLMRVLARAAILHDVGELYLPVGLFTGPGRRALAEVRRIRTHALIGAQVAVELAHVGATVGHLIAMSHERLDGRGYPGGLKADEVPRPAQALLFAESMVSMIAARPNGLQRAAVAARLVPGEFPSPLVNWIAQCAHALPATVQEGLSANAIGMDLLQIETLLLRLHPLLAEALPRETTAVRKAAVQWSDAIEALIDELRRTGIESAVSCGMSVEPQSDTEFIELAVLSQEILYRIRETRLRVEVGRSDSPELGASALVLEFLDLLRACEPTPEAEATKVGSGISALTWSKLFSVGVQQIDEQHRVLFGLLNRLVASGDSADPEAVASSTLAELVDYVGHHFAYEEKLMREHGYEKAHDHELAHVGLGRRVAALAERHSQGSAVSLAELTTFLRQWLIAHILITDKALGQALNAKGVR